MTKRIWYALFFLALSVILLFICLCSVRVDLVRSSTLVIDNDKSILIVSKQTNDLINKHHIHTCKFKLQESTQQLYLSYDFQKDDAYCYWVTFATNFIANDGTYVANANFGKIKTFDYLLNL
ncbi:MAG: hypothetical protein LBT77_01165 [Mycoplasmataceae bacterium]|jgi:hypothetical protein|nr:hypothetical protein [Mycoplasmataceae bacterium]